jgi:SSS family solute:Na+ symporter
VGQITTLVLVVLAILWVPLIETVSDSLWEYLQIVIAYTSPPAVATFILGLFWKRANGTGSIVSLLTGFFLAIFMILSAVNDWVVPMNELHFMAKASLLFVISVLIHVVVSLSTGMPDPEKVAEYTYKKELFTSETEELKALPWYQNYRYLAIILLVITAIVVGSFW